MVNLYFSHKMKIEVPRFQKRCRDCRFYGFRFGDNLLGRPGSMQAEIWDVFHRKQSAHYSIMKKCF